MRRQLLPAGRSCPMKDTAYALRPYWESLSFSSSTGKPSAPACWESRRSYCEDRAAGSTEVLQLCSRALQHFPQNRPGGLRTLAHYPYHEVRGICESRNKESLNLHWGFSDRIMGNLLLPQAACDGRAFHKFTKFVKSSG